jgi:hypothetical protein
VRTQAIAHLVALELAAAAAMACGSSSSAQSTAQVLDPSQPQYGHTSDEWSVLWWQWLYQMPETMGNCVVPLTDPTGASCGYDQSGSVFFLVGNEGGSSVRDDCKVPLGDAIFFPLVNFSNDNAGTPPSMVLTPMQLSALTQSELNAVPVSGLSAEFDGLPITDLARFKSMVDQYTYTLPMGTNVYSCQGASGVSGVVNPSYEAGYWVMLSPPTKGAHTLHFTANAPTTNPPLNVDVTYNFTVE